MNNDANLTVGGHPFSQFRNSNIEMLNKHEYLMTKNPNSLEHLYFRFCICFEFRAPYFGFLEPFYYPIIKI